MGDGGKVSTLSLGVGVDANHFSAGTTKVVVARD